MNFIAETRRSEEGQRRRVPAPPVREKPAGADEECGWPRVFPESFEGAEKNAAEVRED